jgi:hypothetical protein
MPDGGGPPPPSRRLERNKNANKEKKWDKNK